MIFIPGCNRYVIAAQQSKQQLIVQVPAKPMDLS